MEQTKLRLSICMPYYKGSDYLDSVLNNIINQGFDFHEIVIGDNTPDDCSEELNRTKSIIASFKDSRIKYFKNEKDLGYPRNLQKVVSKTQGDILFLMAHDDLLAQGTLQRVHDAFLLDSDIGVVTRPYFWFMRDIHKPLRAVMPYDKDQDTIISIEDGEKAVLKVLETVGQLSGLAYRKKFIEVPFHDAVFPAHIYPFLGIFRKHKCMFLKDFTVAVRIESSQTRSLSSIYKNSPTLSWIEMFSTVLSGKEYDQVRNFCIKNYAKNYLGLVQIKNYGFLRDLLQEIAVMIKNYPLNLLNLKFWFFTGGTILMPRRILISLVDNYKATILSQKLISINFSVQK